MEKLIILYLLKLFNKCPIKSWRDLNDEDATSQDVLNAQFRWIREYMENIGFKINEDGRICSKEDSRE